MKLEKIKTNNRKLKRWIVAGFQQKNQHIFLLVDKLKDWNIENYFARGIYLSGLQFSNF